MDINIILEPGLSPQQFAEVAVEIERYKKMAATGVTELDLRLCDDPMDGLKLIGEHVIPALRAA